MLGQIRIYAQRAIGATKGLLARRDLRARISRMQGKLEELRKIASMQRNEIHEACLTTAMNHLGALTEDADISVLEKYGIKTDRLIQFGYTRIGKIDQWDDKSLMEVPGIGKVKARQIARACQLFEDEVKASFRHKPDPADIRACDIATITALAKYLKCTARRNEAAMNFTQSINEVSQLLSEANESAVEMIRNPYVGIAHAIKIKTTEKAVDAAEELLGRVLFACAIMTVNQDDALADFRARPGVYQTFYASLRILPELDEK